MQIKAKKDFSTTRIKNGFSVTALAKKAHLNASVVLRTEKGNPARPSTAKKICEAMQEDFDTLFEITGE